MRIFRDWHGLPLDARGATVALGNFDGVHLGHAALVRAAHAAGLRAMGGLSMLLYQGAAAFTLWTGYEAPLAAMRAALEV